MLALIILTAYAFAVWSGLYGFGIDYYNAYSNPNYSYGGIRDSLGWKLSTLSIGDLHVGVLITTMILGFSSLACLNVAIKPRVKSIIPWLINFILILHTWPIVMSASNAMRQGLMMSFLYLGIYAYHCRRPILTLLLLIGVVFSHNVGILFAGLFVAAILYQKISIRAGRLTYIIFGIGLAASLVLYIYVIGFGAVDIDRSTRVIGSDFTGPFMLINLGFVFLFLTAPRQRQFPEIYVFLFSLVAPIFFLIGLSWQYERLNQIMLLFAIYAGSRLFKSTSRLFLTNIVTFSLVVITIKQGMFSALN